MVLNQNRLFDIQESQFACFACGEIDNILIHVFLLMICIFDLRGGQQFNYKLKCPCDAFIIRSASPPIDDPQLTLG